MRRITVFLLFLLTLLTGYSQNPFAIYGYEPAMATLSNGRFDEFHDKDRIVEIGFVKFDTKTNKIVGLIKLDTLNSVMDVQTVSRFISIDPHAERYYSISPYAYCNNNPVNYVDLDGKDWYRHNKNGNYHWQEGHDELEGYTNVGSSVSIQLGENSYFNAYQNAGVMANQAVNTFSLISSSAKLQNQFLGKNSPLSEDSKSELFNALVNQRTSEIGLEVGQALLTAEMIVSGAGALGALGRLGGNLLLRNVVKEMTLWPAASGGRSIINGIEYTAHALERMQPVGTIMKGTASFSRGVPPSVIENAIKYGVVTEGRTAAEVVRTFENVKVITNREGTRVISVIKLGH